MIQVETTRPVFSNLTAEEKKARNKKIGEKARGIYTKAKDSGILSGLENLYLKKGTGASDTSNTNFNLPDPNLNVVPPKEPMSKTTKGILIGVGVLAVGVAVWYFAIRKK
jgi:hypothetical protein